MNIFRRCVSLKQVYMSVPLSFTHEFFSSLTNIQFDIKLNLLNHVSICMENKKYSCICFCYSTRHCDTPSSHSRQRQQSKRQRIQCCINRDWQRGKCQIITMDTNVSVVFCDVIKLNLRSFETSSTEW